MQSFTHATTCRVFISCPADAVYEYAFDLKHFPNWVSICQSISQASDGWYMETPYGRMKVDTTERNELGVIDHYVSPAPGIVMFDAMRVLPNGEHSEVFMTVFQDDGMTNEVYTKIIESAQEDLHNLKHAMETAG